LIGVRRVVEEIVSYFVVMGGEVVLGVIIRVVFLPWFPVYDEFFSVDLIS